MNKQNEWELRAPIQCSEQEVFHFIESKSQWIHKQKLKIKLGKAQTLNDNIGWDNGQFQYYLGQRLQVMETGSAAKKLNIKGSEIEVKIGTEKNKLSHLWHQLLKTKAEAQLKCKATEIAKEHGFSRLKQVKLRKMRSSWGNCRNNGVITLNTLLMQLPENIIKAVIYHEISHLKHMNHSQDFYKLLSSLDPDWKAHRMELKKWSRKIFI